MEIIKDDLWLCTDCLMVACNGDTSGIEGEDRVKEVEAGLEALGPGLVPDFDSETEEGMEEFSHRSCDGCGEWRAGSRHRFAILGEVK